jgi:probable F420-dependent oxidoreductase
VQDLPLKVGIAAPNFGAAAGKRAIDKTASLADKHGFSSLWTADHLLPPKEHSKNYGNILESISTLAYLAGRTEHLLLGTGILVFPMREVILLAKQAAAVQILSKDRLLLGLGAGWLEQEFKNVGAGFEDRGQYYDEGIQLFRWLMRGNAEFSGEFYDIDDGIFAPVPKHDIPLYIGGNSGQSLRRAAKLGDGWFPIAISPEELKRGRKKLASLTDRKMETVLRLNVAFAARRETLRKQATSASGEVSTRLAGTSEEILDQIVEYRKAGLNHLVCSFGDRDMGILEMKITEFAKSILSSL